MVQRERLTLYDTTLRDGQQTQGVQFSLDEKVRIAEELASIGIDYIEGGWPGANPVDSDFFHSCTRNGRGTITAFGMTKRPGRSAANDELLSEVLNANTRAVCLVGKTHDFHVSTALGIDLEENLDNIRESISHVVAQGREAIFDAEHFFDGFKSAPGYALDCLGAAKAAGARWVVLCDTNGGTLPGEIGEITRKVVESGIPRYKIGIHTHNDTENAVAGTLAAVDAGARQIQGTLNGLGERCGNANLVSIIPTLLLKEPYRSLYETGITAEGLQSITMLSRLLDDILNRVPNRAAAYVGSSAFVHKAGLHASGVQKDPTTYEHVEPGDVGNFRLIPMSNQAGRSNLVARLTEAGIAVSRDDPRLGQIIEEIKSREERGYSYDTATASFEILARKLLGILPNYFSVIRFRVMVEQRQDTNYLPKTDSEAVAVLGVAGKQRLSVAVGADELGFDNGPIHALATAIAKDLGPYQKYIEDMRLVDFKVRITGTGTKAVTRVIIDSEDGKGRHWSTVGVSPNIINASFEAQIDAIIWKLVQDAAPLQ